MRFDKNEFIASLYDRINGENDERSIADWVCKNTTIKGQPYSFKGHEFQREIINDMHPYLCVKKLSQVGLTECSIRKSIAFLHKNPGTNVLYSFPTTQMKKQNAMTRIKPIFINDFPANVGDSRSTDVMQLGQSYLYVAANVEGDATSTPVDMIVNDEYDLSDMEFIALVNSRIQHSDFKIKQKFSTPTFQGYGVSLEYESSDKREYFYKCPHCNHWHIPKYDLEHIYIPNLPQNVSDLRVDIDKTMAAALDLHNSYVRCPKCLKPLNMKDSDGREWIAEFPERIHSRGYWVRPFSSGLLSIDYLVTQMADFSQKNQLRRGFNTVLGEEYSDSNSRLERPDIEACMITPAKQDVKQPVWVGMDVGSSWHLVIMAGRGEFIHFETIPHDKIIPRLKEILETYNVVGGAVDRHPDISTTAMIRDMSGGRIMPVVYSGMKTAEPFREVDGSVPYYKIDRTAALDSIQRGINNHTIQMLGYGELKETVIAHLRDMYRDDDISGSPRWVKMNGNDHFFHTMGYAMIAPEIKRISDFLSPTVETNNNSCVLTFGEYTKGVENINLLSYNHQQDYIKSKRW